MELQGGRFAVIGGAGFIGSHVVERLLEAGAAQVVVIDNFYRGTRANLEAVAEHRRVRLLEGDILDADWLASSLESCQGAFHLAAAWLLECLEKPRFAVENNILGTYNVMQACCQAGVERVVFSSSASVYGDAVRVPMDEEHPYHNRTLYGATKIAGEHLFRAYNQMFGLRYVGLRYMNVYGPRQDYRGAYTSVIMKILDRLDQGLPPVIYGDGSQTYDFVYVGDVARANLLAMTAAADDACYNVGTGVGTSLRGLVEVILEECDCALPIQFEPGGQTFVTHRIGAVERARRDLGFVAEVPLQEGVRRLIAWRRGDQEKALVRA
ncbi:MAG: NAD-dependent epimerase/dehydratase family protein [Candidatus Latescibacterota bacterium]